MPDLPQAATGAAPLTAEGLARQWRAEADATWNGEWRPRDDGEIARFVRASVLRGCADELAASGPSLVAAAVAAERERIAQLAEVHDAWGKRWHPHPHFNEWTEVPFADLIRQDDPS